MREYEVKITLLNGDTHQMRFDATDEQDLIDVVFAGVITVEVKGKTNYIPASAILRVEVV